MDMPQAGASSVQSLPLSSLADACSRKDLTAIHEILEKTGYKDDEGTANEVTNKNINTFMCALYILIQNIISHIFQEKF